MNGSFSICAGCQVPRISTSTGASPSIGGDTYARAMPWPSVGLKLPLVTMPADVAAANRVPLTRDRPSNGRDRDLGSIGPRVSLFDESLTTDEVVIPRDDPSETRLERRGLFIEILSPERIAHLESERVASTETARNPAGLDQILHQIGAAIRRHRNLGASLPGVSGSRRDRTKRSRYCPSTIRKRPGMTPSTASTTCGRIRPLHGQKRRLVPKRPHVGPRWCALDEPPEDVVEVRSVRHHPVPIVAEPPHDHVVDHAAAFVERHAVLSTPRIDFDDVVAQLASHEFGRARPFDEEAPEVGDVEHAGAVAYGVMLCDDAVVLDGHRPAAEVRETRTELGVEVMQTVIRPRSSPGSGTGSRLAKTTNPRFPTSYATP